MAIREFEYNSFQFYFHFNTESTLVIIHHRFTNFNLNFNLFDYKLSKMGTVFINSWRIVSFLLKKLP